MNPTNQQKSFFSCVLFFLFGSAHLFAQVKVKINEDVIERTKMYQAQGDAFVQQGNYTAAKKEYARAQGQIKGFERTAEAKQIISICETKINQVIKLETTIKALEQAQEAKNPEQVKRSVAELKTIPNRPKAVDDYISKVERAVSNTPISPPKAVGNTPRPPIIAGNTMKPPKNRTANPLSPKKPKKASPIPPPVDETSVAESGRTDDVSNPNDTEEIVGDPIGAVEARPVQGYKDRDRKTSEQNSRLSEVLAQNKRLRAENETLRGTVSNRNETLEKVSTGKENQARLAAENRRLYETEQAQRQLFESQASTNQTRYETAEQQKDALNTENIALNTKNGSLEQQKRDLLDTVNAEKRRMRITKERAEVDSFAAERQLLEPLTTVYFAANYSVAAPYFKTGARYQQANYNIVGQSSLSLENLSGAIYAYPFGVFFGNFSKTSKPTPIPIENIYTEEMITNAMDNLKGNNFLFDSLGLSNMEGDGTKFRAGITLPIGTYLDFRHKAYQNKKNPAFRFSNLFLNLGGLWQLNGHTWQYKSGSLGTFLPPNYQGEYVVNYRPVKLFYPVISLAYVNNYIQFEGGYDDYHYGYFFNMGLNIPISTFKWRHKLYPKTVRKRNLHPLIYN
jgi:hypothetical protein